MATPSSWQKGRSGNPNGRPRVGTAVSDLIRKLMAEKGDDGKPHREAIARRLIAMAEAGDLDAIKVVLDRVDGKVAERIEHGGDGGGLTEMVPQPQQPAP